jgi:kinesin family protein 4/21/27
MIIDRAHRSFASLRNIASENFENQPEVMQNFELNLNSAMHELHSRSERIQELEADIASVKKEMETKMTIISGLTRERSSLKASPMDMSMVANLRDQLERNEKQMSQMREAHESREKELTLQMDELRQSMQKAAAPTTLDDNSVDIPDTSGEKREQRIFELEAELCDWEERHRLIIAAKEQTEAELHAQIVDLEAQVSSFEDELSNSLAKAKSDNDSSATAAEQKHQKLVDFLRTEIDEYKAIINSNATKAAELENAHATAKLQLQELSSAHESASKELDQHRELVASLESQVATHAEATKSHQAALDLVKDGHAKDMSELKSLEQKSYEEQAEVLMQEHTDAMHRLEEELAHARDELTKIATQVATGMDLDVNIESLSQRISALLLAQKTLGEEQQKAKEMKGHVAELTSINENVLGDIEATKSTLTEMLADKVQVVPTSVAEQLNAVKTRLVDLEGRNKKNSRLVEELEEQLQNNFDEAQMTNNRLSTLQTERNVQLEEATSVRSKLQSDLESIREEYAALQVKYQELSTTGEIKRSNSNSTIRKSASHTSLPSPPPAIPLPPLPNAAAARSGSPTNGAPNSPTSGRPLSKDNINISQITEDQEARIRTIEKHLYAERQLTQTLEEALTDLEKQSKKVKGDCDAWKKRSQDLETELKELKERQQEAQPDNRWSMQAVEEERKKRQAAELARKQLEERMNAINKGKKKKGSLNCF